MSIKCKLDEIAELSVAKILHSSHQLRRTSSESEDLPLCLPLYSIACNQVGPSFSIISFILK